MVVFVLFAGLSETAEAIDLRSWDQRIDQRFLLRFKSDTAVLDNETQLLWERNPGDTEQTWLDALSHCNDKNVGERKGWRLPTIQELASLVDPGNRSPALPIGHPFELTLAQEDGFFWSATTSAGDTNIATNVLFRDGGVSVGDKDGVEFVWCVRGGQGVDPQ
jgi:hypothetical protein